MSFIYLLILYTDMCFRAECFSVLVSSLVYPDPPVLGRTLRWQKSTGPPLINVKQFGKMTFIFRNSTEPLFVNPCIEPRVVT